ncbi:hypothetical protein [Algoriphagus antarcticus]|nr:hypothetical protein [Algoriphagus antarcticus]
MTDTKKHDLVRGNFSPEDALEIINHLIAEKINFHEMRSFSSKIRFGEVDQNSEVRIKELKQSKASINVLISNAKEQGKTLKIESTISVELI